VTKEERIATVIGLKPSMIYKIKRGDRHPSFKAMANIEKALNWPIADQVSSRKKGNYHVDFEKAIAS
jgi:ribosome-binding protein aMBF1 (putative translation factor)